MHFKLKNETASYYLALEDFFMHFVHSELCLAWGYNVIDGFSPPFFLSQQYCINLCHVLPDA